MVEQAEAYLMGLGFRQMRVRIHGRLARVEVLPEDMDRFLDPALRAAAAAALREMGFLYVTLDLQGYRMGSMNEAL